MILGSVSSSWEKQVLGHLASCEILNDSSQEGVGKSSLINHIFKVEEAVRRELLKCPRFSSGRLHRKYPSTHREQPTSTRKYSLQQMILSSSTIRGAIELERSTIFKNWQNSSTIELIIPGQWVIGYMLSGTRFLDSAFILMISLWMPIGCALRHPLLVGVSKRLEMKRSSELSVEKVSHLVVAISFSWTLKMSSSHNCCFHSIRWARDEGGIQTAGKWNTEDRRWNKSSCEVEGLSIFRRTLYNTDEEGQ